MEEITQLISSLPTSIVSDHGRNNTVDKLLTNINQVSNRCDVLLANIGLSAWMIMMLRESKNSNKEKQS